MNILLVNWIFIILYHSHIRCFVCFCKWVTPFQVLIRIVKFTSTLALLKHLFSLLINVIVKAKANIILLENFNLLVWFTLFFIQLVDSLLIGLYSGLLLWKCWWAMCKANLLIAWYQFVCKAKRLKLTSIFVITNLYIFKRIEITYIFLWIIRYCLIILIYFLCSFTYIRIKRLSLLPFNFIILSLYLISLIYSLICTITVSYAFLFIISFILNFVQSYYTRFNINFLALYLILIIFF